MEENENKNENGDHQSRDLSPPAKIARKIGRRTLQPPEKLDKVLAILVPKSPQILNTSTSPNSSIVHTPGKPKKCQFCSKQFRSLGMFQKLEKITRGP